MPPSGASSGVSGGLLLPELRRVAEEHAPEGGYGETAYNQGEGTVYWVPADWSTNDEIDAAHDAFMALDGVNGVVGDAESRWPDDDGWKQVWPIPGSQAAYERVLALAQRPLSVEDAYKGAMVPASAHYRPATVAGQNCGTCSAFNDGHCSMFAGNPPVQTDMVCDEWNPAAT
jgi:hypothetical protein